MIYDLLLYISQLFTILYNKYCTLKAINIFINLKNFYYGVHKFSSCKNTTRN